LRLALGDDYGEWLLSQAGHAVSARFTSLVALQAKKGF
jgi:hypothetical protein